MIISTNAGFTVNKVSSPLPLSRSKEMTPCAALLQRYDHLVEEKMACHRLFLCFEKLVRELGVLPMSPWFSNGLVFDGPYERHNSVFVIELTQLLHRYSILFSAVPFEIFVWQTAKERVSRSFIITKNLTESKLGTN